MDRVIGIINRANQRGGRMLSMVDLIERETLTLEQAAYLTRRVDEGASWLVGASPGGAGKTAVMCALLGMLPPGTPIRLTVPGTGWEHASPGDCIVAYEISPGAYDAYVWGEPVRRLARLGCSGCRVVTNLHADTLDEALHQIGVANGVPQQDLAAFEIFLPIEMNAGFLNRRRVVKTIHDRADSGTWRAVDNPTTLSDREQDIAAFFSECLEKEQRAVEVVRNAWQRRLAATGRG